MLKDITFGQYFAVKSPIHSLDPRNKILLLILTIVFIFITKNIYSLLLITAFVFFTMLISRVPIKLYFKNLKAILPIIILTTVINLFYGSGGVVLLTVWKITITSGGLLRAVYLALRILMLISASSVLTYTTTPNDLTDAIERLLGFLKIFGLGGAVHTLALMMTIALRFIPTLVEETEKIMNAQKARGADIESGNILQRIKALVPILIPLLISSIRRAYDLAEAMECRCYNGGKGRKRMKQLTFSIKDLFAAIISVAICSSVIVLNIFL